jgi:GntP family gluconate:H+ symporter
MVGKTPVALLITVLYALWMFRQSQGRCSSKFCNDALAPVCAVILVTGAGGMFGGVLRASGIGTALADVLSRYRHAGDPRGLPGVRRAAGCPGFRHRGPDHHRRPDGADRGRHHRPERAGPDLHRHHAGGATVLSHFNDSGFWLVSRFLNMDEKTTLKTWTVMETLLGTIAFLIVATASAIL